MATAAPARVAAIPPLLFTLTALMLQAQAPVPPAPVTEQIPTGNDWVIDISVDGALAALRRPKGSAGFEDLLLRDLRSGAERILVTASAEGWTNDFLLSNDGRKIAYRWTGVDTSLPSGRRSTLWYIGTEPGAQRQPLLTAEAAGGSFGNPVGWSPDDKWVLAMMPNQRALRWVSVADGAVRQLPAFEPWRQAQVEARALSPDGAWIAFSARRTADSPDRDIFIVDRDGRNERALVTPPGRKSAPVWTPDSQHILFAIDSDANAGLWSVPVRNDGVAARVMVAAGADSQPLRVTSDGVLFSTSLNPPAQLVLIADRHSGRISDETSGSRPAWSPDGASVAFTRSQGATRSVVVRTLATGVERIFANGRLTDEGEEKVQWMKDGRSLFTFMPAGEPAATGGGFYRIDLSTAAVTALLARNGSGQVRSRVAVLSPDERVVYAAVRASATSPWHGVVAIDLSTGAERVIGRFPGAGLPADEPADECGLAISPDGKTLAILAWTGASTAKLMTIDTADGAFRELLAFPTRHYPINLVQWTRDGRHILYADAPVDGVWRVMRISASGGQPEPDGLTGSSLSGTSSDLRGFIPTRFELSPDETRIAFDQWTKAKRTLWRTDRFMRAAGLNRGARK